MKGQASYQLLVVSPEVRKSRVKRKGSGEMGVREGKKKTKIVISKLSHALHDSLQTLHHRAQGSLAKFGGQEILAGVITYPKRKKSWDFPLWW